jgi:proline dehydrogenase
MKRAFNQAKLHGYHRFSTATTGSKNPLNVASVSGSMLDFTDTKTAFASKSTGELFRAWYVLYGCSFGSLVKRAEKLYNLSLAVFGNKNTHLLIEKTLFRHFCAGVDEQDIVKPIKKLEEYGVGGILDYAAEAKDEEATDDSAEGKLPLKSAAQARVHEYSSEAKCDENAEIFKHAINAVHNVSPKGFAAVKLSALGEPALMERMSVALLEIESFFTRLGGGSSKLTFEQFLEGWKRFFTFNSIDQVKTEFDRVDGNKDGVIDLVDWMSSLSLIQLTTLVSSCKDQGPLYRAALNESELIQMKNLLRRCEEICGLASDLKVRVMIDAEWTAIQPAIDNTVMHMQRKYNTLDAEHPVVFNTYQTYLLGSHDRVRNDLDRSKREAWKFGAKVVRGAYMVNERERANRLGIESPIYPNYKDTEANFHSVLSTLLADASTEVMVASHNERTIKFVLSQLDKLKKSKNHVYFGQLLGMADHLTFTLAANKYQAYKYIPYGPVDEVMPYLIRRTQENSTLLGTPAVVAERKMLFQELRRRLVGF